MNATGIGLEIRRARRRAGLTQTQLAERLGTKQPAIARLETGRALPSMRMLNRIVDATGRPIDLRFGETPPAVRRENLRRVLGSYVFDPRERDLSPAELRALEAQER